MKTAMSIFMDENYHRRKQLPSSSLASAQHRNGSSCSLLEVRSKSPQSNSHRAAKRMRRQSELSGKAPEPRQGQLLAIIMLAITLTAAASLSATENLTLVNAQHFLPPPPPPNPFHPSNYHFMSPFIPPSIVRRESQPPPLAPPGAASYLAPANSKGPVRVPEMVLPYEGFQVNSSQDLQTSYIIENRRYIEAAPTRCYASTILENPDAVEPAFVIITRTSEIRLNATAPADLVLRSGFDPKLKTTILVHGFTQSYPNTVWLRKTRALFEIHSLVGRQNLIIMDWGNGAQGSYAQVAAMVSGMGSFLANFLMKLLELGTDRLGIHIVGHSLGAHLAGFAGKRIRPRIGRITALDPAGPCFGKFFSNSPLDRLSPDDAYQVAVYHYDDDFLGLSGQHGQFDVYVNGGSSQPGCQDNMNTMVSAVVTMLFRRNRVLSESHTRSTEVSSCQLSTSGCQQVAYECRDYAAFKNGECGRCDQANNQCFLMSLHFQYGEDPAAGSLALRTSFPGKRLYISTGANEPFCSQHYQVLVKFEPIPELAQVVRRNKWKIQLELVTDVYERLNITLSNQMAPNIFSHLLLSDSPRPMRFRSASLQVRQSDGNFIPLQTGPQAGRLAGGYRVLNIEVNYMSNINPQVRRAISTRLCPMFTSPGGAGKWNQEDSNLIHDKSPLSALIHLDECFGPPPIANY